MSPLPGNQLAVQGRFHVFGSNHPLQRLARSIALRAAALALSLHAAAFLSVHLPKLFAKKAGEMSQDVALVREMRTELPQAPSVSGGPSGPVVPGFKPGGRPPTAALGIPDPVPDLQAEAPTIASQTEMGMPIDPNGIEGLGGGGGGGWASPQNLDQLISGPIDSLLSPDAFVAVEQMPTPITIPRPNYPQLAREAGIEGQVKVRALVGTDGKVRRTLIVSGPQQLQEAAERAVMKGSFRPALQNSRPVQVWVVVPINFSLN
jgi:protein TonB